MANITKRTAKRLAKHLADGEQVQVAILVEPKGSLGAGAIATAALPRTSMRRLREQAEAAREEAGGMAAGFPADAAVVVVTDRRILVAPSDGLRFKDPELEVNRGGMLLGDRKPGLLRHRLQFVFGDGSAVEVDAQRTQPIDELAAALGVAP